MNLIDPAKYMLPDIAKEGIPAWQSGDGIGARYIAILYLAETSVMARRWTSGMRSQMSPIGEILGPTNMTLSEAITADTILAAVNTS